MKIEVFKKIKKVMQDNLGDEIKNILKRGQQQKKAKRNSLDHNEKKQKKTVKKIWKKGKKGMRHNLCVNEKELVRKDDKKERWTNVYKF